MFTEDFFNFIYGKLLNYYYYILQLSGELANKLDKTGWLEKQVFTKWLSDSLYEQEKTVGKYMNSASHGIRLKCPWMQQNMAGQK